MEISGEFVTFTRATNGRPYILSRGLFCECRGVHCTPAQEMLHLCRGSRRICNLLRDSVALALPLGELSAKQTERETGYPQPGICKEATRLPSPPPSAAPLPKGEARTPFDLEMWGGFAVLLYFFGKCSIIIGSIQIPSTHPNSGKIPRCWSYFRYSDRPLDKP